ncbi:MAG TPA: DoxX family protein [Edaphobacter sp.]|nr:DoxX family protein [Edaphobacter sp.]
MHTLLLVLQVIVALGLLNVWLLRFGRSTPYRGGNAQSMRDEFAVYGLPAGAMYAVGTLKVLAAICLLAGIWVHALVFPAAAVVAILMVGALAMHLKVHDPMMKSLPALSVLVLSLAICWLSRTAI